MDTSPVVGRPVPLAVASLIGLILLGTAFIMALGSVSLAGDGSYYLVRILGTEDVFGPELRFLGNALRQAPVLIVARSGLTDTHLLSVVFGVGLLVVPALIWAMTVMLSRSRMIALSAVAMTAGLCAGTTWFFSIGENVVVAPLTVLVSVLLWQPQNWGWRHALLATAASVILVATYETTLLTGPILVLWAAWRARASSSAADRYGGAVVAMVSALSIVAALAGIFVGRERTPAHVWSLLYFVVSTEPWQFYLALASIVALTAAMIPRIDRTLQTILLGSGAAAAAIAISSLIPTTAASFAARGGAAIAALALQLFLFWDWTHDRSPSLVAQRRTVDRAEQPWLVVIPVLFVAAMAFADVRALTRWSQSLDAFQSEVNEAR